MAYVSGRSILDGPLIANEFIDSTLGVINHPARWRLWVSGILKSARASVLINGSLTWEFQCHRGVRQGDHLSPLLFITALGFFSHILNRAVVNEILQPIRIPNGGPLLSHLLFADDTVLMCIWSEQNIMTLARLRRSFYLVSGLRINLNKSNLFGVNVANPEVENMAEGVVGDGTQTLFWIDKWVGEAPLCTKFPSLFNLERNKRCTVREKTLEGSSINGWNWTWIVEPATSLELQEFCDCLDLLPGRTLGIMKDKWKWALGKEGEFTIKSVQDQIQKSRARSVFVMEWNRWVSLKINLFGWRAEMGRIATWDALFKRNVVNEIKWCPLCEGEKESAAYVLMSCYVATSR
ncbi:uncharacterized protein LOC143624838 [Bidens hawaiensis]|uniref:uncharacterized protein LOC143624838 n=1 Tax=Bidens hawaiensis TaxID=980011 RepID=UPI0040494B1E